MTTRNTTTSSQKLWNLCNVLKDDGVTYHQYVTELTYLLFLKMAKETGTEDQLPKGYRWHDLEAKAAPDRLEYYKAPADAPRQPGLARWFRRSLRTPVPSSRSRPRFLRW